MYSTKLKTLALSLLLAIFSTAAVGQTPSQPAPADKYVTNSGFKNRVFEVHNRMPDDLVPVIRLLPTGFRGRSPAARTGSGPITLPTFPETIGATKKAFSASI